VYWFSNGLRSSRQTIGGGFRGDSYAQIDVSWHAVGGLMLYIDGQLVDQDANPATNELDYNSTLRFLIGRANTDMRHEHFTNGIFDNVEFWETTRSVMKSMGFLLTEGQKDSSAQETYCSGRGSRLNE